MRVLDTDVLIDIQRGHPPAVAWFASLTERPAVPLLAVMELLQDAANKLQVNRALALVAPLNVVYTTPADQQRALQDYRTLHLSHRLGLLDALIAATTIGLGATLCTFNVKHFQAVPGLTTEQPYAR
jgi:predicted nucleic acid-binding protein